MGEVSWLTYICTYIVLHDLATVLHYFHCIIAHNLKEQSRYIHTGLVGELTASAWAEGCFTSVRFLQGSCHLMELLPETSPPEQGAGVGGGWC